MISRITTPTSRQIPDTPTPEVSPSPNDPPTFEPDTDTADYSVNREAMSNLGAGTTIRAVDRVQGPLPTNVFRIPANQIPSSEDRPASDVVNTHKDHEPPQRLGPPKHADVPSNR